MMPFSLGSLVGRLVSASTLFMDHSSTGLNSTVAHPISLYGSHLKRCPFVHTCVPTLAEIWVEQIR